MSLSNKEQTTRIKIRVISFTTDKRNLIIKKIEEHNLHMRLMEWPRFSWPTVCVQGDKEDIENFFNDLKNMFILPPYYF